MTAVLKIKEIGLPEKSFLYDSKYESEVKQYCWHVSKGKYAQTNIPKAMTCTGKRETTCLHQLVMYLRYKIPIGCKAYSDWGDEIDHINHDTYDNRMANLQFLPAIENSCKQLNRGRSKYIGVVWHKGDQKWQVQIRNQGKREYLGKYLDEIKAARVYDKRARELGGKRKLNFPNGKV